jgi:hypothetical protein
MFPIGRSEGGKAASKKRRLPAFAAGDGVIGKCHEWCRERKSWEHQQVQQTGMLFMHRQHTQPALDIADMQSQQAWIIAQQSASPLVQVMQTPSLVWSHLHMPIVMLHEQTIMPFIIMQQLHIPPAIMEQRF